MRQDVASRVLEVALRQTDELTKLVDDLTDHVDLDEHQHLRRAIAQVLGELFTEIIRPVLREHPDLRPPGLMEP